MSSRRTRRILGLILGVGLISGALAIVGLGEHAGAAAGGEPRAVSVYVTYYGWYDNTPPGCATAYSGCARGTGTYSDPLTFASDKKEFPVGTILYYPTAEKYVRMGDDCQECDEDWSGKGPNGGPHLYHIDIWTGGKGGDEFDAINCEDALTQGLPDGSALFTPMIVDPPRDEPVSTEPLFDPRTGHCYGGATTETSYGRYRNAATGACLVDPSSKSGVAAVTGPCNSSGGEDIAFDGLFLVVGRRCLETSSGRFGSRMEFATCNGNPRQQWEVNPNGTITWVQYTRCVAASSAGVRLKRCTGAADERWAFHPERSAVATKA